MSAQLRNVLAETQTGKTSCKPRAEWSLSGALILNRIAEDLADLLFRATPMTTRTNLELRLDVLFEMADQELSHAFMIARYPYSSAVTRQITLPTSSAISRAPLLSIATPTGRPMASPFSLTKPVSTSTGSPDGLPPEKGTKITL